MGITTFGESRGAGPGVSGIVRIEEAAQAVELAVGKMASAEKPGARLLPVEPEGAYPLEAIKEIVEAKKFDFDPYLFGVGEYEVAMITPLVQYRLATEAERKAAKTKNKRNDSKDAVQGSYDFSEQFRNWAEYAGQYKPVLFIQSQPELGVTKKGFIVTLSLSANVVTHATSSPVVPETKTVAPRRKKTSRPKPAHMRSEAPLVAGDFLGLPGLRTTSPPEVGDFSILVRAEQERPPSCPYCGCAGKQFHSNGTRRGKTQELLDEPRGYKRVRIKLTRRNFRYEACRASGLLPLWGVGERQQVTDRLVCHVEQMSLFRPFAEVALTTGLSRRKIKEVFDGYVRQLRETVVFEPPRVIGLDGIKIRKKGYFTVITDVERRLVLHMWNYSREGKKDNLAAAVRSLVNRLKVMEGAAQVEIVVDRFHLQRMANEAVDCARIRLNKALRKEDKEAETCNAAPLRKPFARLKEREKAYLDEWLARSPMLRRVYERKEEFRRMWAAASAVEAKRFYEEWMLPFAERAPDTEEDKLVRKDFSELHSAMRNCGEYVLNYVDLDRKPTNAFTEWANRRIRDVVRESRGCGVDVLRAKLIFGTWMKRRMREGADRWGESTVVMARTRRPSTAKSRKSPGDKKPKKPASRYKVPPAQPSLF